MSDDKLLELAAKAAGYKVRHLRGVLRYFMSIDGFSRWNPISDDGDSFRLAVTLKIQVVIHNDWVEGIFDGIQLSSPASCYSADGCMFETTRRAIVNAAAAIGKLAP